MILILLESLMAPTPPSPLGLCLCLVTRPSFLSGPGFRSATQLTWTTTEISSSLTRCYCHEKLLEAWELFTEICHTHFQIKHSPGTGIRRTIVPQFSCHWFSSTKILRLLSSDSFICTELETCTLLFQGRASCSAGHLLLQSLCPRKTKQIPHTLPFMPICQLLLRASPVEAANLFKSSFN